MVEHGIETLIRNPSQVVTLWPWGVDSTLCPSAPETVRKRVALNLTEAIDPVAW